MSIGMAACRHSRLQWHLYLVPVRELLSMRKFFACFTLLLTALMVLPSGSGAQDKKDKKKPAAVEEGTPQEYAALGNNMKDVLGTIAAVDTTAHTMTLTIEFQEWEPNKNPGTAKNVNSTASRLEQEYTREYNKIMTNKNPISRQQAMLQLQQTMTKAGVNFSHMFKSVKTTKDFNIELKDPLKVARSTLETKYDDMGEIITYTDEQKKKMKSPDVSGAYVAKPEELKVGQAVKVIFAPAKKKTVASATKEDTNGNKTTIDATVTVPVVRTVIINQEPPEVESKVNDTKKKKKN